MSLVKLPAPRPLPGGGLHAAGVCAGSGAGAHRDLGHHGLALPIAATPEETGTGRPGPPLPSLGEQDWGAATQAQPRAQQDFCFYFFSFLHPRNKAVSYAALLSCVFLQLVGWPRRGPHV